MSFDDDDWGRPVEASGDWARVDQLSGRLLIIFPVGYIENSLTRFSVPGKKSDVIVSDVIDLDDNDEHGNPGKVYRTAWWRSAQLIVSLRPFIGKKVLGRIGKGVARNGMNPPWVVNDAALEPGAIERARAWAQANQGFALSTFTQPVEQAPPRPQPQYQPPPQQYQPPPQNYSPQPPPPQQQWPQPQPQWGPEPQYQPPPPAPQYQQQPAPPPPPQPQYQQQPAPQPQYQPPPPQPQQQYPAYPVAGAPQQHGADTLELMRAQRERRLQQGEDPPF